MGIKFPKFMLGEVTPGVVGVFNEPENGVSPHYFATIPKECDGIEPFIQLILASPGLLEQAENILEYIAPYKQGDIAYNQAILDLKRACTFARRDLNLETTLWREHFFHGTQESLSKDFGQPVQAEGLDVYKEAVSPRVHDAAAKAFGPQVYSPWWKFW